MSEFEIETLPQLLAVALAAERSVADSYADMARRMRDSGNADLAELFAAMAESEHAHAAEVEDMIETMGIKDLPQVPAIPWQLSGKRGNRDWTGDPATSTPYLALAYAANNEELAYRYYSYVAASAKNEEVCRVAETFAREELSHAALLRERRRLAYHEHQAQAKQNAMPEATEIHTRADLLAAAGRIERRIHGLLCIATANHGIALAAEVANTSALADGLEREQNALCPDSRTPTRHAAFNANEDSAHAEKTDILHEVFQAAEQAYIFYDCVSEISRNEATMLKAQELTKSALDRITTLGALLDN